MVGDYKYGPTDPHKSAYDLPPNEMLLHSYTTTLHVSHIYIFLTYHQSRTIVFRRCGPRAESEAPSGLSLPFPKLSPLSARRSVWSSPRNERVTFWKTVIHDSRTSRTLLTCAEGGGSPWSCTSARSILRLQLLTNTIERSWTLELSLKTHERRDCSERAPEHVSDWPLGWKVGLHTFPTVFPLPVGS